MTFETVKTDFPLDLLRERLEQSWRERAGEVLRRHGLRITPAERASYATRLRSAPGSDLLPLRRRLLDRLLRDAGLRRRSRHDWKGLADLEMRPRGPYNDRAVLEAALRQAAASDALWTREFLDLYARLEKLRAACRVGGP